MKLQRESEKGCHESSFEASHDNSFSSVSLPIPTCTSNFDYALPEDRIAQRPLERRESSRLLVSPRSESCSEPLIADSFFGEISAAFELLRSQSAGEFDEKLAPLVILNDSRVYRARIPVLRPYIAAGEELLSGELAHHTTQSQTNGVHGEVFVLRFSDQSLIEAGCSVEVLLRPQKKFRLGEELWANVGGVRHPVFRVLSHGPESCQVENLFPLAVIFDGAGEMPLPPYIRRQSGSLSANSDPLAELDNERYQTAYADKVGSAAAPTAGLHFSQELLERLRDSGAACFAKITLHVGLGTFRPVQSEDYTSHHMHEETYSIPPETLECIFEAVSKRRPIVYVGTTSFRAVESFFREYLSDQSGELTLESLRMRTLLQAGQLLSTSLFVHPSLSDDGTGLYQPCIGHAMITNFHQPRSTLLMLVASLIGVKRMWAIYSHALSAGYRFLSYGDGSLLRFSRRGWVHDALADQSKGQ